MKQNWEREKNMEKENNTDESNFSENEIRDLHSLKPFEFEPKINRDINSSSSDAEKEGTEYEVTYNIKEQRVMRVQCKSSRWQMFFEIGVRPATLLKRDSNTGISLWKLRNF